MVLPELLTAALLGLILGSFATALTHRVPRHINWVGKRSFCPACEKPLGIRDLVPLFSWLASAGKCRSCKIKISIKYPCIEIAHALIAVLTYLIFGLTPEFYLLLAALPILTALLLIDLEQMILPNQLVLLFAIIGVVRLLYICFAEGGLSPLGLIDYIAAAFIYAGLSWFLGWFLSKFLKKDSLGFGDVKFFFAAGLWLGLNVMPQYLMLSGVMGIFCAVLWRIFQKTDIFPFGPALITALYILLLFQGPIIL